MSTTSDLTSIKVLTQTEFNNNVSSTDNDKLYFVETKLDGQWTYISSQIANSVSLAIGTDAEIEYDLSSVLPNDGYSYEVKFSVGVQTGSGSGAGVSANLIGKGGNGNNIWTRICDTYARGSWIMVVGNHATVPINSTRKVVFKYSVVSKAATLNYIFVEGYRRIGTST